MASAVDRWRILGAALLFSTGGAAVKATSLTGWQVASFRSGLAALALAVLLPRWRRGWRPGTLLVALAYATTMICYVVGNKLTTAANTIFLQGTAPLYLLLLGPWLLGERVRRGDLAFASALAAGMVLLFVGTGAPLTSAPEPTRGNLVAAGSGLAWGLTLLGLRWLERGAAASEGDAAGGAVVLGNALACLIALPPALPLPSPPAMDWIVVGYLGLVQIGLAYFLLTKGMRGVTALEASLLLLLEPVLNPLWAWVLHAEPPGAWTLIGGAVILCATLLHARRRS